MSDYRVNPMEITEILKDLTGNNDKLQVKIGEMQTLRNDLAAVWEGDAKDTFSETMRSDIQTLQAYHELMQSFCAALYDITVDYVSTESNNISVITADAPSQEGAQT